MPWARFGDNAATYPQLLAVEGSLEADDRLRCEVFGFLAGCATLSASHKTDYVVNFGTALVVSSRAEALINILVAVGLVTLVNEQSVRHGFIIVQDPDFIHIRTKQELEDEKNNRIGRRSDYLKREIRKRDGDNCRWCGIGVHWSGTSKSERHAEVDHLEPDGEATPETLVVACKKCNGARGENRLQWDATHELCPVPERPIYGKDTAAYLTRHGYPTEPNHMSDAGAAPVAAADPAAVPARPAAPTLATQPGQDDASTDPAHEAARPETMSAATNRNRNQPRRVDETGCAGPGRDGTVRDRKGRDGPGLGGSPPLPPRTSRSRKRGKRGRRGHGKK